MIAAQETNNEMTFINGMAIRQICDYPGRPTLVFLHDSLSCIQLWRDLPQLLAAATQCNILIYDRIGYGKSESMPTYIRPVNYMELEADILNDLLTELAISDAILFGNSDGGTIALLMAAKYPERVSAVIIEAAHIFVEELTLAGIHNTIEIYNKTNLLERLQKYHGEKAAFVFKSWTETWIRTDYRNWNIEHWLSNITAPLLFIQGEADEYGTAEQYERTLKHVGGRAEKHILPAVGHTPHKEAPEKVLAVATDFINSISQ